MGKAYVVAAKRSAIGSFMDGFTNVLLANLGIIVSSRIIEKADIDPANIDEVIVGDVIAAGLGQDIGRQVSIRVGAPVEVCVQSLNILCGSGLKTVVGATMCTQCRPGDIFIAGGVESMTNAPYLVPSKVRNDTETGDMKIVGSMPHDGLADSIYGTHMGVTTDNITKKHSTSREGQDAFAYVSRQKAIAAIDSGRFQGGIVPVEVPGCKGSVTAFNTDKHPNRASTPGRLAKLRPAFTKDGTAIAGNAPGISDGASFTIIASENAIKKYSLTPLAEVTGIGQGSVDPRVMSFGPTPTTLYALKYADLCIEDMELVELNEAFAAQSLGVIHEPEEATGMDRNAFMGKTSVDGGVIALGHPVGVFGNRILVSLLHEMQKRGLRIGLASLRIDGEQGAVVTVKYV